jgi:polysaccharide biosynthesis protein PelF
MTAAPDLLPAFPRLDLGGVADVGLLLEGTYPFVSGGVSTWVHEIVTGFPELTFGICFLGATPETYGDAKYRLPPNVVHLEVHYLMERQRAVLPRWRRRPTDVAGHLATLARLHEAMRAGTAPAPDVVDTLLALDSEDGLSLYEFLHDDRVFAELCAEYDAHHDDSSFIDYFWTLRTMHVPLFKLAAIARSLPRFRALHAVSTGYAGALGAMVHRNTGTPLILTEHGIYTKERTIDLAHAAWINDGPAHVAPGGVGSLRRLWIQFFEALGRMAYAAADPIVSLSVVTSGARRRRSSASSGGSSPSRTSRPSFAPCARWWPPCPRRRPGSWVPKRKTAGTPKNAGRWPARLAWTARFDFSATGGQRTSCRSWGWRS